MTDNLSDDQKAVLKVLLAEYPRAVAVKNLVEDPDN
jgi:hypothetical protein